MQMLEGAQVAADDDEMHSLLVGALEVAHRPPGAIDDQELDPRPWLALAEARGVEDQPIVVLRGLQTRWRRRLELALRLLRTAVGSRLAGGVAAIDLGLRPRRIESAAQQSGSGKDPDQKGGERRNARRPGCQTRQPAPPCTAGG